MALSPTLRYYRGQFNPESAYQQTGGGDSGIVSMYNPEQEGQFIDAISKRQERFDTTNLAQQQERIRIGETETYDLAELNNRLKSFETSINDLVKNKYNGDYGAAANEIAKQIGTERTNPFYHFNKQKVEAGKSYLDAKMKIGASFLSSGDPFKVSFNDWQQGQTFDFTPIDSKDITQRSAAMFQNMSKQLMKDTGLMSSPEGQYFRRIEQYGFKDEAEALDFIQNDPIGQKMAKQLYDSMPELSKVENQDAVIDSITQGVYSGIGTSRVDYMTDQSYLDALQQSRIKGGAGASTGKVISLGYMEGPKNIQGKSTSIPIHGVNYMYGTTSQEGTEITSNLKGINNYLSKSLQPGDIQGMTEKDSKLLKDVSEKELVSFSLVPTTDPNDPYVIVLNILGTPQKTKGSSTPVPVPISTKVVGSADKLNLFTQLSLLDPSVFKTYMEQLKEVNPSMYKQMIESINTAKTK